MKIGILTLPLETNYGGNLQAFALQRTLINLGHDVITIDRHNRREYPSLRVHILGYCKRLFFHYVKGKNVSTKWNPFISDEEYASSAIETQKFISRNIKLTRRIFSDQLVEIENDYQFDAYVVGSDQIWNGNYCPSSFLDFVKREGVKKVVYAASCGNNSFFSDSSKTRICRDLAKDFSGISVRENILVDLCKQKLSIDAQWVLDPTMLLSQDDYLSVTKNNVGSIPVLFSYILDSDSTKDAVVANIAKSLDLPVINGNRVNNEGDASKTFPPVDDWIHNINRSQFVVTDSFHGTVFAIIFNKQFISIGNKKRGMSRFLSLLRKFGLENRLIDETKLSRANAILGQPIDFELVNSILEREKTESIKYLSKVLQ